MTCGVYGIESAYRYKKQVRKRFCNQGSVNNTMTKYHTNPETGNSGVCKAEVKCRFGMATEHFTSKIEAREAYEKSNSSFFTPDELTIQATEGPIKLTPGIIDANAKAAFTTGQCLHLAYQIAKQTNRKVLVIGREDFIEHAYVVISEDELLDIYGVTDEDETEEILESAYDLYSEEEIEAGNIDPVNVLTPDEAYERFFKSVPPPNNKLTATFIKPLLERM